MWVPRPSSARAGITNPKFILGKLNRHSTLKSQIFPFSNRCGCPVLAPLGRESQIPIYPRQTRKAALTLQAMPSGLSRYQDTRHLHFITFSCYHRQQKLGSANARNVFEQSLEQVRSDYAWSICGYVVMPEHVHMLVNEPEIKNLALAIQSLKQSVARTLALRQSEPFWQARYYDFNVWSEEKRIEKLKYIHRNPVRRGLVSKSEDWPWSSFRHFATGVEGTVEIESQWTADKRDKLGLRHRISQAPIIQFPT